MDPEKFKIISDTKKNIDTLNDRIRTLKQNSPVARVAIATSFRYSDPGYVELDLEEDMALRLREVVLNFFIEEKEKQEIKFKSL